MRRGTSPSLSSGVPVGGPALRRPSRETLGLVPVRLHARAYEPGQARQWRTPCGRFLLRQSRGIGGVRYRRTNGRLASRWSVLAAGPDGTARAVLSVHRSRQAALVSLAAVVRRPSNHQLAEV